MKKRLFSTILAAVLAVGALSGCNSNNVVKEDTGELPEIITYMPYFTLGNQQELVDEIGKRAGVNFKPMSSAGTAEGVQRSALIITTGERVHWVNIDNSQPFQEWGAEGFINDLAPYLEKYKDELPLLNMIANDPIFKGFRGENGEIYVIPSVNYNTNTALRMNQAWLDKIGAEAPKTLEELTDILRKFKDIAAKEDGAYAYAAKGLSNFEWAFLAYGGRLKSNGYPKYYKENNEFLPYDISDMNKEALKYLRGIYEEGLVNSDWQVADVADKFISGKSGMTYTAGGTDVRLYENAGTVSAWLEAPEGPTGVKSYGGGAPYWCFNVIPASITDEEEIHQTLKFIEWMHGEEGRKLGCYGIEGVHYELTEDGKIDRAAHRDKMDNDFGIGNPPDFEWGWVSPYKGALDPKYGTVTEAIKNIKLFEVKKEEPVDESYMDYIKYMSQWVQPYEYDTYISEELKFAANSTMEYVDKFYTRAITEKDFDFDKEWENFKKEYMETYNGAKCLEIFKGIVEKLEG